MDIKRFKEALPSLLMSSAGDAPFASLRILTHGMSGVRTAKIINFACKCMGKDEFYIEVGTFSGYSLISAGYQLNSMCVGIDDLSMKEVMKSEHIQNGKELVKSTLLRNMSEYGSVNLKFIESDFRAISLMDESKGKLAVLFIDGDHTYADVKEAMEKFSPFLADDALIIFDDVQFGGIPKYIHEMHDQYDMLAYLVSTVNDHDRDVHMNMSLDERIANGICVMVKKGPVNA